MSPSLNLLKWLLCFPSFCLGNEILSSSSILTTLPTAKRRIRTPHSTPPGNALSQGFRPHNHAPDNLIEEKSTFFSSLKRKAADQRITATQNIVSEILEGASKDLYMHRDADMMYVGMAYAYQYCRQLRPWPRQLRPWPRQLRP